MRTYNGLITKLLPNEIFVFGSNTEGRHGKGAALTARLRFGAVYGQASGLQGQSYGIVTKDLTKQVHPSVDEVTICTQIDKLYRYASSNPHLTFYIAYAGKGTPLLNGYNHKQMAEMFLRPVIPDNIVFEKDFANLIW